MLKTAEQRDEFTMPLKMFSAFFVLTWIHIYFHVQGNSISSKIILHIRMKNNINQISYHRISLILLNVHEQDTNREREREESTHNIYYIYCNNSDITAFLYINGFGGYRSECSTKQQFILITILLIQ